MLWVGECGGRKGLGRHCPGARVLSSVHCEGF